MDSVSKLAGRSGTTNRLDHKTPGTLPSGYSFPGPTHRAPAWQVTLLSSWIVLDGGPRSPRVGSCVSAEQQSVFATNRNKRQAENMRQETIFLSTPQLNTTRQALILASRGVACLLGCFTSTVSPIVAVQVSRSLLLRVNRGRAFFRGRATQNLPPKADLSLTR